MRQNNNPQPYLTPPPRLIFLCYNYITPSIFLIPFPPLTSQSASKGSDDGNANGDLADSSRDGELGGGGKSNANRLDVLLTTKEHFHSLPSATLEALSSAFPTLPFKKVVKVARYAPKSSAFLQYNSMHWPQVNFRALSDEQRESELALSEEDMQQMARNALKFLSEHEVVMVDPRTGEAGE